MRERSGRLRINILLSAEVVEWQTRTFEGRVAKAVRVQVPPSAPKIILRISSNQTITPPTPRTAPLSRSSPRNPLLKVEGWDFPWCMALSLPMEARCWSKATQAWAQPCRCIFRYSQLPARRFLRRTNHLPAGMKVFSSSMMRNRLPGLEGRCSGRGVLSDRANERTGGVGGLPSGSPTSGPLDRRSVDAGHDRGSADSTMPPDQTRSSGDPLHRFGAAIV